VVRVLVPPHTPQRETLQQQQQQQQSHKVVRITKRVGMRDVQVRVNCEASAWVGLDVLVLNRISRAL
jgi:hypothetical protein